MRIADIGHLDLDLPKAPSKTRVVVAMSGGVDSSVTAGILSQMGYDVIGITLQLYDHGVAVDRKGACCAGQDIHDARRVADQLGIPHYVLDMKKNSGNPSSIILRTVIYRGKPPFLASNATVR